MKSRLVLILVVLSVIFTSCGRYISPLQAANGKAKCGKWVR